MRVTLAISVCLLGVLAAAADEPEGPRKPLAPNQAADAVLAAVATDDEEGLKRLAEMNDPDPWDVADALCYRGEHDVAEAFAGASSRGEVEALPAYVESRRRAEPDEDVRRALASMGAAAREAKWQLIVDLADALDRPLDSVARIDAAYVRARALGHLKRHGEHQAALHRVGEAARDLGWLRRAARCFHDAGKSAYATSALDQAVRSWSAWGDVERRIGDPSSQAQALVRVGVSERLLGRYDDALKSLGHALELFRELDDEAGMARTRANIGNVYLTRGDLDDALDHYDEAVRIFRKRNDRGSAAMVAMSIGSTQEGLGRYDAALRSYEGALEAFREMDHKRGIGRTLLGIGIVQRRLQHFDHALRSYQEALGVFRDLRSDIDVVKTLNNLGVVNEGLGNHDEALKHYTRALELSRRLDFKLDVARALNNIGVIHRKLGEFDDALACYEKSLPLFEELGLSDAIALTYANIGAVHIGQGDDMRALEAYERALPLMDEAPNHDTRARVRWGLAEIHLRQGAPGKALDEVSLGLSEVAVLSGGLAEGEGAGARDVFSALFDIGYRAALETGDAATLSELLERGRAGSLRESLGTRDQLDAAVLPEALRRAMQRARRDERLAYEAYGRAYRSGKRKARRDARRTWEAARDKVVKVANRIEREAKHAAAITVSEPDDLATIQSHLRPTDALLYYALTTEEGIALVVRRDSARIVTLPDAADIGGAVNALLVGDKQVDSRYLVRLEKPLVEPLDLGDDVERILISPMGRLGYVPFSLLFPDHEVALVPSGTAYGLLLEDRTRRGQSVLAVGDPHYGPSAERARSRAGRMVDLPRLPATRKEVEAIGDISVLGEDATETGLPAAINARERWRAVHLACHGFVDPERPLLSALALTADEANDGLLSALEIFQMRVPADLVVMSACDTGKGRVYMTEGIVGLTRAFMFAGSPRVICSLWKVDDEATRALMVKFYELWNPKDGSKGMGAAAALKAAQAFVREHPDHDWSHPYYWAAWVLWGLPD